MSERTGHPQLDQLIEQFLVSSTARHWELERFRSPAEAEGRCYEVAEAFTQWLQAQAPDLECVNAGDWQGEAVWYGYDVEPWQDPTHAATAVRLDGHTYTIDWTASQFDCEEFPAVRRVVDIADKPSWARFDAPSLQWESAWPRQHGSFDVCAQELRPSL